MAAEPSEDLREMGRCSENACFQTYQVFLRVRNCIRVIWNFKDSELAKGIGPAPTALSKLHVLGRMGETIWV